MEGKASGYSAGEAEAFAAGILKGKAEGEAAKQAEIAKNLLGLGMDIHQIVLVTGLTEEQIRNLQ